MLRLSRAPFALACLLAITLVAGPARAAGDVAVESRAQTIRIVGDGAANQIYVALGSSAGLEPEDALFVVGRSGTTVNGDPFVFLPGPARSIAIDLGDGDDVVDVEDLFGPLAPVDLEILAGDGDDRIGLWDVSVVDDLRIDGGSGDDAVVGDGVAFGRDLVVDLQTGDDRFSPSLLIGGPRGRAWVRTGAGDDAIELESPSFTGPAALDAGAGSDLVLAFGSFDHSARVDGGRGDDRLVLSGTRFGGPTVLRAGPGNDVVSIVDASFEESASIDGGGGHDRLEASAPGPAGSVRVKGFEETSTP